MPALNPGDIVLVDHEGLIIQLVEPAELGFWGRTIESIRNLTGWGSGTRNFSAPEEKTEVSPWGLPHGGENTNWTGIQIHSTETVAASPPGEEHPYGGESGSQDKSNAISILRMRTNGGNPVSYHYLVDKSGRVVEVVSDTVTANHGVENSKHIGISLVNLAHAKGYADDNSIDTTDWFESPDGLYWEPFPKGQVDGLVRLIQQLIEKYPTIEFINSHEELSANKADPGPAFDEYWDRVVAETALVRDRTPSIKSREA